MVAQSRTLEFGSIPPPSRYQSALVPVRNGRNLLTMTTVGSMYSTPPEDEGFIDEKEAVAEVMADEDGINQSGEGLLDVISAGANLLGSAAGKIGSVVGAVGKAKKIYSTVKKVGDVASELAFGKVGTTISNKLSEQFNKNPEWRPGFAGEKHVVLNTKFGLTRANFCGPNTQIVKRSNRGDVGVNQIDSACHKHDLLYHFARTPEDIRRADREMIREVDNVTDAGAVQKALAKGVIKGKIAGEEIGIFGPETFTKLNLEGQGIADRMYGANRHLNSIIHRVRNLPMQSLKSRFGGNGVTLGHMLSGNDVMKTNYNMYGSGVRKTGLLGNVKGRDPTISNMNSSFIQGAGFNAIIPFYGKRFPNTRSLAGGGLLPQEARDLSGIKSQDKTIGNLITAQPVGSSGFGGNQFNIGAFKQSGSGVSHVANPGGSGLALAGAGLIDDVAQIAKILPGNVLKKSVLKSIRRAQRKKVRQRVKGGRLVFNPNQLKYVKGKEKGQKGGIFGLLAGLAASIVIPEVIKLIRGKGKKGKGLNLAGAGFFGDVGDFFSLAGAEVKRDFNKAFHPQKKQSVAQFNAANRKKSDALIAARKLSQVVQQMPGRTRKRKPVRRRKTGQVNIHNRRRPPPRPRSQRGKGPARDLIMKMTKRHGLMPMNLSHNALAPLIKSVIKKQRGGTINGGAYGQGGGQFGMLAGLAASAIIPKVIAALHKKNKSKKRRR